MRQPLVTFLIMTYLSLLSSQSSLSAEEHERSVYTSLNRVLPYHMLSFYTNASALEWLISQTGKPSNIIEVGSYLGASTAHFASLLKPNGKVYAVDWWTGPNYAQSTVAQGTNQEAWGHQLPSGVDMYEQFLSNMVHLGLTDKVEPIRADSRDGAALLKKRGVYAADLVYLDADHSYSSVLNDCRIWYPFVSGGRGILCGDDWSWSWPEGGADYELGVQRAVIQFAHEKNLVIYTDGVFWALQEKRPPEEREVSPIGQKFIAHVLDSIKQAELGLSRLDPEALVLDGMSSPRVRRFLNNLCSLEGARYLEIGSWKGSTLVAALSHNEPVLAEAVAIDNWTEFGGPREEFFYNVQHYLSNPPLRFYEADCFSLNTAELFPHPFQIYFYDGNHSFQSQKNAFTFFDSVLDHTFIAVVDDWNVPDVQAGTFAAFNALGYRILFQVPLFSPRNCTMDGWWNGIYVAVIEKSR